MKQRGIRTILFIAPALSLLFVVQGCAGGQSGGTPPPVSKTIAQIQVTGQPVKFYDHSRDQQEQYSFPDAQITAWKEANGTVNLMLPNPEAYRMRGPDLEHLTMDTNKIYSSSQSALQIPEDLHNYTHWVMGPYSLDGSHFYTLAHSEWYACLLNDDCSANNYAAQPNSWANTVNSLVSADGGASWQLNVVNGNHVVAETAYVWTGSEALAEKIYLHDFNHTGMFQPSRVIKEGDFYYSVGYYIHRDFSQINPAAGVYQAPADKVGYVLMRTNDVTNPNNWQAWTGGSTYEPLANINFNVFFPQQNGTNLDATPAQIIYDTNAQCYILIHTLNGGSNAVYYMTTKSLAQPVWSDSTPIIGTATLVTDPAGPATGFNGANYPSILDDSSSGFNFEFTSGNPLLFFSTFPPQYGGDNTKKDGYYVQLSITYQ